jgi:hypothetical protein
MGKARRRSTLWTFRSNITFIAPYFLSAYQIRTHPNDILSEHTAPWPTDSAWLKAKRQDQVNTKSNVHDQEERLLMLMQLYVLSSVAFLCIPIHLAQTGILKTYADMIYVLPQFKFRHAELQLTANVRDESLKSLRAHICIEAYFKLDNKCPAAYQRWICWRKNK